MTDLITTNPDRWLSWMLTSNLTPSIFRTPKGLYLYVLSVNPTKA